MTDDNHPLSTQLGFVLNGTEVNDEVANNATLLSVLRENRCRSVRASCERGVCGACTVLVDGEPVASCSTFAFAVDGAVVETVEGLAGGPDELSPQQEGFARCGGFQCGFCTSGMLMLTTALLRHDPDPSRETIREWISSSTCRCTGYEMIFESVELAARLASGQAASAGPTAALGDTDSHAPVQPIESDRGAGAQRP